MQRPARANECNELEHSRQAISSDLDNPTDQDFRHESRPTSWSASDCGAARSPEAGSRQQRRKYRGPLRRTTRRKLTGRLERVALVANSHRLTRGSCRPTASTRQTTRALGWTVDPRTQAKSSHCVRT